MPANTVRSRRCSCCAFVVTCRLVVADRASGVTRHFRDGAETSAPLPRNNQEEPSLNTSDFSSLATVFANATGIPLFIVAPVGFLGLFAWVCWRTRSMHLLMTRVWRVVFGKVDVGDRDLSKFIETRNRLMKFRFFSGINFRTLAQAKRLSKWATENDEEVSDVRACGGYFNRELCQLNEKEVPGRSVQLGMLIGLCILLALLMFSSAGMATNRAIYKMKDSGVWFLFSDKEVTKLFGDRHRIDLDDCAKSTDVAADAARTPYTPIEYKAICKALSDPHVAAGIRETVGQQRVAFGTVSAVLLAAALSMYLTFRQMVAAFDMMLRLSRRRESSSSVAAAT